MTHNYHICRVKGITRQHGAKGFKHSRVRSNFIEMQRHICDIQFPIESMYYIIGSHGETCLKRDQSDQSDHPISRSPLYKLMSTRHVPK